MNKIWEQKWVFLLFKYWKKSALFKGRILKINIMKDVVYWDYFKWKNKFNIEAKVFQTITSILIKEKTKEDFCQELKMAITFINI